MSILDARLATRAGLLAAVAILMIAPMSVAAHAELDTATPADGSTVEGSPPEVSGTFTQIMKPEGSSLQLRDESGDVIAEGGVDPVDPKRMSITDLPELAPGTYEVRWTTISAEDNELARDRWTFTVVEEGPSPPPEPTETPAPTATPAPSATPAPTPTPSAATAAPTSTPTAAVTASASAAASVVPSAAVSVAPSAAASPAPSGDTGEPAAGTSDVLLPIIVGLALVVVAAVVLVRRRGQTSPPA